MGQVFYYEIATLSQLHNPANARAMQATACEFESVRTFNSYILATCVNKRPDPNFFLQAAHCSLRNAYQHTAAVANTSCDCCQPEQSARTSRWRSTANRLQSDGNTRHRLTGFFETVFLIYCIA